MRFSLDSNAVIALLKGQRSVIDRLRQHGVETVGLSSIVLHELYFGARRAERVSANVARVEALPFTVLAFDHDDAIAAAEARLHLQRQGTPIGQFDLLIAGQALARDLTLITHNLREFERVPGLRVQDWQQ